MTEMKKTEKKQKEGKKDNRGRVSGARRCYNCNKIKSGYYNDCGVFICLDCGKEDDYYARMRAY